MNDNDNNCRMMKWRVSTPRFISQKKNVYNTKNLSIAVPNKIIIIIRPQDNNTRDLEQKKNFFIYMLVHISEKSLYIERDDLYASARGRRRAMLSMMVVGKISFINLGEVGVGFFSFHFFFHRVEHH